LKLKYDCLLSNFAFKFNLRRYILARVTMVSQAIIELRKIDN